MEVFNTFESSLKNLNVANSSNSLLLASNLIGKKIRYEGSETYIQKGKGTVEFKLKDFADFVKITITDKDGQPVETKTFSNLKGNTDYPFEIDNPSLKDGYYKVYVEATKDGEKVDSTIISEGLADGVVKEDGKIKILFGNTELDIDKIVQIGG
jgi:flagellar basal-body rod modification protein FlgD